MLVCGARSRTRDRPHRTRYNMSLSAKRKNVPHAPAMPRLNFAQNITKYNTRWPPTISWDEVCTQRGAVDGERRAPLLSLLSGASDGVSRALAIRKLLERLPADLAARHVLCDASSPCAVQLRKTDAGRGTLVKVCIPRPPNATAAPPVVCEPYGEMWQQLGGEASRFNSVQTTRYKLLGTRAAREAFERSVAAGKGLTDLARLDPSYRSAYRSSKRKGSSKGSGGSSRASTGAAPAYDGASVRCASFELQRVADWLTKLRASPPFVASPQAFVTPALSSMLTGKSTAGGAHGGPRTRAAHAKRKGESDARHAAAFA